MPTPPCATLKPWTSIGRDEHRFTTPRRRATSHLCGNYPRRGGPRGPRQGWVHAPPLCGPRPARRSRRHLGPGRCPHGSPRPVGQHPPVQGGWDVQGQGRHHQSATGCRRGPGRRQQHWTQPACRSPQDRELRRRPVHPRARPVTEPDGAAAGTRHVPSPRNQPQPTHIQED